MMTGNCRATHEKILVIRLRDTAFAPCVIRGWMLSYGCLQLFCGSLYMLPSFLRGVRVYSRRRPPANFQGTPVSDSYKRLNIWFWEKRVNIPGGEKMKSRSATFKRVFSTVFLVVVFATAGYAAPFDEIVVFGDSLSDNGNLLLIENQPKPDPAVYFEGRFSNGPVWVEYLADAAHFNVSLSDRALGGAQSGGVIGLMTQIDGYIATTGPSFSDTALFVIWIGGNDFFNGDGDSLNAVGNIKDALERLVDFGARNLLVVNLPDLGLIPDELGSPEAPQATEFTLNFNADLANRLDIFRAAHPEVNLYEFDADALFTTVRNDPAAYGFTNVTDPSPNFDVPNNFDGAGYAFWDGKHPTTAMHAVMADQVYADVTAQVPPPDTNTGNGNNNDNSTCFIGSSMN